jgi:NADH dehydrogenase
MQRSIVTGAFGFLGSYIARNLLQAGATVHTLTNSSWQGDELKEVNAYPLNFNEPDQLKEVLKKGQVLYNTYWVRFNYNGFNHQMAVKNSKILFEAAQKAGIERIVHISITNPSTNSELSYFRGKAQVEEALKSSGIPYTILRPAILFGEDDILINNIAWLLRTFPVFGLFGRGQYKLQPIYVNDLAQIAVQEGQNSGNKVIDAIGPETFTYRELAEMIGEKIGYERPFIPLSETLALAISWIINQLKGDVLITRQEIKGLKSNKLYTDSKPLGWTKLTEWLEAHAQEVGREYHSELARR